MTTPSWNNPIVKWIDYRLPIFTFMHHDLVDYPTPRNLNYWWNFGSLAGIVLVIMIVTGIVLAMHYTPHVDMAFASVERIMRDVNYGWLIRYVHMTGGSMSSWSSTSTCSGACITGPTRSRGSCSGSSACSSSCA